MNTNILLCWQLTVETREALQNCALTFESGMAMVLATVHAWLQQASVVPALLSRISTKVMGVKCFTFCYSYSLAF